MYNSWVEISKSAILHNLNQFQKLVGKSVEIMPIIKSNAYGHGIIETAKIISPKIRWLGVVSLGEALALRRKNFKNRIFILSYAQSRYLKEGIRQNVDLPVYDLAYAKLISDIAGKLKKIAKVHIKIDTGASRIGILAKDAIQFIKGVEKLPYLKIEGVYSHFAASEENQNYTDWQLNNFNQVLEKLERLNLKIPFKHFACSAATITKPEARFNLIRLGLSLYGFWPSKQVKKITARKYPWLKLKPVLSWKTKILQIKIVPAGTKIGYGCTFTAKRQMKIAVLPVGYWEGYDRHLSNRGEVLIKNKKCPMVGRVCMNLMMINVTKIKKVKAGEEVILIGQQGREEIVAEDLAEKIGTINYEVVTRINPALPRIIIR